MFQTLYNPDEVREKVVSIQDRKISTCLSEKYIFVGVSDLKSSESLEIT
jgi:hypothetical protein